MLHSSSLLDVHQLVPPTATEEPQLIPTVTLTPVSNTATLAPKA